MTETRKDYLAALIFMFIGVLVLVSSVFIKNPGLSEMGPREFPRFIGICMVVLSAVLMLKTAYKGRKNREQVRSVKETGKADQMEKGGEIRALAIAGICLVYAIAFTVLGYFVSTFLAITGICLLFREKRLYVFPVLYMTAVVIWLGFTYLLSIHLP